MTIKKIFMSILIVGGLLLTGCETLGNPANHYLDHKRNPHVDSPEVRPLNFPPDLRTSGVSHDYDLPSVQQKERLVSLTPPGSYAERVIVDNVGGKPFKRLPGDAIKIQQQQQHLVMLIKRPLPQAWDSMDGGLRIQHFKITKADDITHQFFIKPQIKQSAIIRLEKVSDKETQVALYEENGKPMNNQKAEKLYARLSDGLRGENNAGLLERMASTFSKGEI